MALPLHFLPLMLVRIFLLLLFAIPCSAQHWGVTFGSGPFIFGSFAESRSRISNGLETKVIEHVLSASTTAGAVAGVERFYNDRVSLRAEVSFTKAPIAVKSSGDEEDSVSVGVGDMSVSAFVIPVTFRFNRRGTLRPFISAGPAAVAYDVEPSTSTRSVPLFRGTRVRAGAAASAGAEWWISNRWIIRGEVIDIVTQSPLKESDLSGAQTLQSEITIPHNLHTTIGVAYRF